MGTQFLTLNQNTSTKNWSFVDFSAKFSRTSTATISRGAPQSAHLYQYRKNKSNEIRFFLLFSNIPVAWAFHVSSLPAPARQLKFPPVCKSPTSGASDTPQNRKNQNWSKTQRQMTFCETYVLPIASQSKASPSLHIDAQTSPKCKTHLTSASLALRPEKSRKFLTFFRPQHEVLERL